MFQGMFGAKVFQRRDLLQVLTRAMVWMGTGEGYGLDQELLARLFWPRVKDDAVNSNLTYFQIKFFNYNFKIFGNFWKFFKKYFFKFFKKIVKFL